MKLEYAILFTIVVLMQMFVSEIATENYTKYLNQTSKPLSRRKRFLLFPEGSSFQLVFCTQTAAVITIGDIFLYGNTASMAWSLPTDSKILYMLSGYKKEALRRGDMVNNIFFLKEGKVIARKSYKNKFKYLPAFSKRSIEEDETFKQKLKVRIDRMKMHERQNGREYLKKDQMDEDTKNFHRSSRVNLFEKLEKLLTAIGQDGRQCVLYKLCQAAQSAQQQGTFLEEFFRVIFTLPKGAPFTVEEHRQYDAAHTSTEDCEILYPGCEDVDNSIQITTLPRLL